MIFIDVLHLFFVRVLKSLGYNVGLIYLILGLTSNIQIIDKDIKDNNISISNNISINNSLDKATLELSEGNNYIYNKINELRKENGLQGLFLDKELLSIAEIRAKEVSKVWSHTRPDGSDSLDMISMDKWAGENLSYIEINGSLDKEEYDMMFSMLCESKPHLENMIFNEFTKIGIASYIENNTVYVAYIFSN